jgi:hypothetical protein
MMFVQIRNGKPLKKSAAEPFPAFPKVLKTAVGAAGRK